MTASDLAPGSASRGTGGRHPSGDQRAGFIIRGLDLPPYARDVDPFTAAVIITLGAIRGARRPDDIATVLTRLDIPATADDVRGVLTGARLPGGTGDRWSLSQSKVRRVLHELRGLPRPDPIPPPPPPRKKTWSTARNAGTGGPDAAGSLSITAAALTAVGGRSYWTAKTRVERAQAIRELWASTGEPYHGPLGRFSEIFGITRNPDDDWFDAIPAVDTPLHVDPFLMFSDTDPHWADSQEMFVGFFDMIARVMREMQNEPSSSRIGQIAGLLQFPEPAEFALGVSVGHAKGAGIGAGLGAGMAEALEQAMQRGLSHVERPEVLALLRSGIGLDRTSDLTVTILKKKFISYTQQVAARHGLKTARVEVTKSSWWQLGWRDEWVELPVRPGTRSAILLVPQRFLRPITMADPSDLFDWARTNHAEELRESVNELLQSKLDFRAKVTKDERRIGGRQYAASHPQRAQEFIKGKRFQSRPYDFEQDPDLLVRWLEAGRTQALAADPIRKAATSDDLPRFVHDAVGSLKDAVEQRGLWRAFWEASGSARLPKVWQTVCVAYLTTLCERSGVKVSRPVDMVRGQVNMRAPDGKPRPVTIHLKEAADTYFFTADPGARPEPCADQREVVAVVAFTIDRSVHGFTDHDGPLHQTHRRLTTGLHEAMEPTVIDARPRLWN